MNLLNEIVESIVEQEGMKLVELNINDRKKHITITIYKKEGVTIDDCERISRELSHDLEFQDIVRGEYSIEVSSPGINRKLKSIEEYKIFSGKEIKIVTDIVINNNTWITGILKGVNEKNEILVENGYDLINIPYIHIKRGELITQV